MQTAPSFHQKLLNNLWRHKTILFKILNKASLLDGAGGGGGGGQSSQPHTTTSTCTFLSDWPSTMSASFSNSNLLLYPHCVCVSLYLLQCCISMQPESHKIVQQLQHKKLSRIIHPSHATATKDKERWSRRENFFIFLKPESPSVCLRRIVVSHLQPSSSSYNYGSDCGATHIVLLGQGLWSVECGPVDDSSAE